MSHLRGSIDELEVDGFQRLLGAVLQQRLSENQRSLLNTNNGTLKHEPVLVDLSVVDESSHGGDTLGGKICLGLATGLILLLSDAVNLLVKLGTVEVSVLTSTGNSGGNTGRVPRSDTSNLSETTVGLTGKTGDSPTGGDTFVSLTLGNSDNINVLVLGEDRVDSDFLLEKGLGKINLGGSISSIDLDLHDVGLLQSEVELLNLGVSDNTNNSAELLDALQLGFNVLGSILVLLGVLGVSLFLGVVPVLVASALEFFTQVLSENSGESAKTVGGLDVSDNTNNDHGRGLNDGNGVDDFLLVHEGTSTVNSTDDVGHTGLVSTESGKVRSFLGIVLGEGSDATSMALGTLLGQESQVTTARSFELSVRPVRKSQKTCQNILNKNFQSSWAMVQDSILTS